VGARIVSATAGATIEDAKVTLATTMDRDVQLEVRYTLP
jgi:hypothetical protein